MIFARVGDVLHVPERDMRIDHVVGVGDERVPFMVLRHRNRPGVQFFGGVVGLVGFTLEDVGVCIVGFLDFAHNNRFEFATGVFKVVIRLAA